MLTNSIAYTLFVLDRMLDQYTKKQNTHINYILTSIKIHKNHSMYIQITLRTYELGRGCYKPPLGSTLSYALVHVILNFNDTNNQLPDIFTKPLHTKQFCKIRREIGMIQISK